MQHSCSKPQITSSDVLFWPQSKDIHFGVTRGGKKAGNIQFQETGIREFRCLSSIDRQITWGEYNS